MKYKYQDLVDELIDVCSNLPRMTLATYFALATVRGRALLRGAVRCRDNAARYCRARDEYLRELEHPLQPLVNEFRATIVVLEAERSTAIARVERVEAALAEREARRCGTCKYLEHCVQHYCAVSGELVLTGHGLDWFCPLWSPKGGE
jgi:hypothetical protein